MRRRFISSLLLAASATVLGAQQQQWPASWKAPQAPVRLFGNVYYVGARGVSAILITSAEGHVLLDAPMAENVSLIVGNIAALGFRIDDVKLILNSHAHFDHAGAIAELQRLSGARVAVRAPSERVLTQGRSGEDDPQFGVLPEMPPVRSVTTVEGGETLRVGPLALTAHATAGHTAGGTSWTWRSCQDGRCLDMVYADSLTAVSADGFLFTRSARYPTALRDFEASFSTIAALPCDVLLTPHPEVSNMWERVARRDQGEADALIDRAACSRLAESARAGLRARLDRENAR